VKFSSLAFFFAILLFATPTQAQTPPPNCGFPQTLQGTGPTPINPGSCPSKNGATVPNTSHNTDTFECYWTPGRGLNPVTYASHASDVTGNGQTSCPLLIGNPTICYAQYEVDYTEAANANDFNRFYNRAYDVNYVGPGSPICARNGGFRQDFWQAPGHLCCQTDCPGGKSSSTCYQCGSSPIILDLDGNGFHLTNAVNGVMFDISGSGHAIQLGWTAKGVDNGFLALPGPDGLVHNGKQLFGNFTTQPPSQNLPNGFNALAVYDDPKNGGNGDGVIDSHDLVFASLRIWVDANHDGVSQPEELHTLPSVGVNSLSLKYKETERIDQFGNHFRYLGRVNPGDASTVDRKAYDVFFVTANQTASACNRPSVMPKAEKKGLLAAGGR
jgi:hypothetical protein